MVDQKVVVSVISLILVVGVVVGLVATVVNSQSGDENNGNKESSVWSATKSITAICAPTDYKDACERTLGGVTNNVTSSPKDFVLAAIKAAKDEVIKLHGFVSSQKEKDGVSMDECKKLLGYAVEDLEFSLSTADQSNLEEEHSYVRDILNWLTAVYSFQQQCMGSIKDPDYQTIIRNVMVNATELTSNALAIVAQITEIAEDNNLKRNSRKLLDIDHDDAVSNPSWFSAADRNLLALPNEGIVPDVVVAKDGSGSFKTINQAVSAYPKNHKLPPGKKFIIYVKAGIYEEQVIIARHQENVLIYGDGPSTVVTGRKNRKMNIETANTATFAVEGRGFVARGMAFRNTAGPEGKQAVALRVMSDYAVIFDCRIEGYQDTLLYQNYRQFYRDCVITGTIDFIFGYGSAVIQNSEIVLRKPEQEQNTLVITADGKLESHGIDGLVIQKSKIVMEPQLEKLMERSKLNVYLGRPWSKYSTTLIMESDLGRWIHPAGYLAWAQKSHEKTCNYMEFANEGLSADTNDRVKWNTFHALKDQGQVVKYTAGHFIDGERWLKSKGVPFNLGFTASH